MSRARGRVGASARPGGRFRASSNDGGGRTAWTRLVPLHAVERLGAAGLGRRSTIRGPDAATPHLVCLVFAGGARNGSAALASPLWVGVHGGH